MAKFGSASVAVTLDDGPGGSPQTITPYVQELGGIKIEQITEETSPFGVAYEAHTPVGKQRFPDVTIGGIFDTAATVGPHVVLGDPDDGPSDATRTFTFTPGGSKTCTVEVRLVSYEVMPKNGGLARYAGVIRQAGLAAWT